jgi:hypothetical protein
MTSFLLFGVPCVFLRPLHTLQNLTFESRLSCTLFILDLITYCTGYHSLPCASEVSPGPYLEFCDCVTLLKWDACDRLAIVQNKKAETSISA